MRNYVQLFEAVRGAVKAAPADGASLLSGRADLLRSSGVWIWYTG